MTNRLRTRDQRYHVDGNCTDSLGNVLATDDATVGRSEQTWDTINQRDQDNVFDSIKLVNHRWTLNGTHIHPDTLGVRIFNRMPAYGGWIAPPNVQPSGNLTTGKLNDLAWKTLAKTNPNVSPANGWQFGAEGKDFSDLGSIPLLIKQYGRSLLKLVAYGYVFWRWAAKPMINDLRRMFAFNKSLQDRINFLKRISTGASVKRKALLESHVTHTPWTAGTVHSKSGLVVTGLSRVTATAKLWGTVRYKAQMPSEVPTSDDAVLRKAQSLILGINSATALSTVWELLPWSWFTDWFLDVGQMIDATNNTVPLTHSTVCIMRTTDSRREYRVITPHAKHLFTGDNYEALIRKERRLAYTVLPFTTSWPIMDGSKWSILTALAALKARRLR